MKKDQLIKKLTKIAQKSEVRIQVAAGGIGDNGKFIWGVNSYDVILLPFLMKPGQWTFHAEMHALLRILRANTHVNTLVIVAPKNRKPGYRKSKPCEHCMATLKNSGRVRKIMYFDGKKWVVEKI